MIKTLSLSEEAAAVTRSPAHWPRRDGVFLCAMARTPLPSPAVNCLQTAAAPEKEGQSWGSSVTNTSRKSLVTGKSGMIKEKGICSGLGTERGRRGWGERRRQLVDELLGQNVPKKCFKKKEPKG